MGNVPISSTEQLLGIKDEYPRFGLRRAHALASGRVIRILSVLDDYTREWLGVTVGISLPSGSVVALLSRLFRKRGLSAFLRCDNGAELIANDLRAWLSGRGTPASYTVAG